MYYIILIVYYTLGLIFFFINDFIISKSRQDLTNSELLDELL